MKKLLLSFLALSLIGNSQAQLKNVLNKAKQTVTKSGTATSLSNDEIINGLKEALNVGTEKSASQLSKVDGFFKDAAIKILMPEEAKNAEKKLRAMGLGK